MLPALNEEIDKIEPVIIQPEEGEKVEVLAARIARAVVLVHHWPSDETSLALRARLLSEESMEKFERSIKCTKRLNIKKMKLRFHVKADGTLSLSFVYWLHRWRPPQPQRALRFLESILSNLDWIINNNVDENKFNARRITRAAEDLARECRLRARFQ